MRSGATSTTSWPRRTSPTRSSTCRRPRRRHSSPPRRSASTSGTWSSHCSSCSTTTAGAGAGDRRRDGGRGRARARGWGPRGCAWRAAARCGSNGLLPGGGLALRPGHGRPGGRRPRRVRAGGRVLRRRHDEHDAQDPQRGPCGAAPAADVCRSRRARDGAAGREDRRTAVGAVKLRQDEVENATMTETLMHTIGSAGRLAILPGTTWRSWTPPRSPCSRRPAWRSRRSARAPPSWRRAPRPTARASPSPPSSCAGWWPRRRRA